MDGAWPDYDEETAVGVRVVYYAGAFVAAGEDGLAGGGGLGDFVLEEVGGGYGVVAWGC